MNKLLIIEDDISIAELERDYLEANGFTVEMTSDGESGLNKALENSYSLIILDLMLPNMDGFTVCRKLRAETDIPILMVSARKEDIDKIRGLGLGADDYLTKPFSPGELVARVKAHLMRYERLTGKNQNFEEITIRGLSLNKESRRVRLNEKDIMLTGKEFDVLYLLASNPDRVYTKEEIFSHIWEDSFGDNTTVTVHIRNIREKIEFDPSKPQYIETIWGVGYRFSI
jgi:DNA-binding response OmpR family regulator